MKLANFRIFRGTVSLYSSFEVTYGGQGLQFCCGILLFHEYSTKTFSGLGQTISS